MKKNKLYARHYFRQMLLLTIAVLLALCVLFTGILYANASKSMLKNIAGEEAERTNELLRKAGIYMGQFVANNTVFNGLNIPYEQTDVSANYWTRTIYDRMIWSHVNSDSYTQNIDVMLNGRSTYPSPVAHERTLGKYSVFVIYTEEEPAWPYYFDLTSAKRNGVESVTLTVSAYHLSKELFNWKDGTHRDYLLLSDGTVLLANEKTAYFINIEEIFPGILEEAAAEEEGPLKYGDYRYILSRPDKYGFRMLSMVEKGTYTQQYRNVILQTLVMSLILWGMAILLSCFLVIRFYRPIRDMVNLLKTYIPEDLQDYENEIAFLDQNVSKYVEKGRELEVVLPQTIARMQEAQAASMQHQINSHFLFNTLENMKAISIAELGIDNQIENCIVLLNTIIRESVLQKNAIVSLSDEIHLADSYLKLMQIRFPGVQIRWSVDESLLTCRVFKFTLQPVLENCFIHAFKSRIGGEKRIDIQAEHYEDGFVIRVCDNGCGIDGKTLERLKSILDANGGEDGGSSVGIRNIQKRITVVFGPKYGITLYSTPEKTVVEIRYPVTENPEGQ